MDSQRNQSELEIKSCQHHSCVVLRWRLVAPITHIDLYTGMVPNCTNNPYSVSTLRWHLIAPMTHVVPNSEMVPNCTNDPDRSPDTIKSWCGHLLVLLTPVSLVLTPKFSYMTQLAVKTRLTGVNGIISCRPHDLIVLK